MDNVVKEIVEILDKKHGEEIVVLDISKVSNLSDYFVVTTANSDPHMDALREGVLEYVERESVRIIFYDKGKGYDWMVIDGGYFIIHIFSKKGREFYSLEDLWLNAKRYTYRDLVKDEDNTRQ
ncbi:MAG TPA: ribosome silencing factor [Mesotoga infera]|uniref:Ribosomal silencing factor RsfS n=1 Tax=Mesotoga infera TaxID=1236046 RepID=A0A7C1CUC1_9BACT|nr:ribosome silencing factor [Mesotoga infera]